MQTERNTTISMIKQQSTITVYSHIAEPLGIRNARGVGVEALPQIKIVAEFNGAWKSKEALRNELDLCVKKLISTCESEMLGC